MNKDKALADITESLMGAVDKPDIVEEIFRMGGYYQGEDSNLVKGECSFRICV